MRIVVEFNRPAETPLPFERSITAIVDGLLALTGAEAAFVYELTDNRVLVLRQSAGRCAKRTESARLELTELAADWLQRLGSPARVDSPQLDDRTNNFPEVLLLGFRSFAVVPIPLGGRPAYLTLGSRNGAAELDRAGGLGVLVQALGHLLRRGRQLTRIVQLSVEFDTLRMSLADQKIAERSAGMLERATDLRSLETINNHVEQVLDSIDSAQELCAGVERLEVEVAGRELVIRAKTLLQQRLGISEEEAYLRIRNTSRQSRRKLRDVADEIVHPEETRKSA
jgi:hypothetical protein